MFGYAVLTAVIILNTKSKFSSHSGSPPNILKFLVIPFAEIALTIFPRISSGTSYPPSKSQVSGLWHPGQ